MTRAWTVVQEQIMWSEGLKGGCWVSVARLVTAQSVKGDILVQSWVRFAAQTKFEEICNVWVVPNNSAVCNSGRLLKSDVSD